MIRKTYDENKVRKGFITSLSMAQRVFPKLLNQNIGCLHIASDNVDKVVLDIHHFTSNGDTRMLLAVKGITYCFLRLYAKRMVSIEKS